MGEVDGLRTELDRERTEGLRVAEARFGEVFGDGRVPLPEMRVRLDAMMARDPLPDGTTVEPVDLAAVPVLQVTGAGVQHGDSVMVWLHGGGYVMGSAQGYVAVAASLSTACDLPVLLPDYRLAPEHPFPAALDDVTAVLAEIGHRDVARCVLGGDSAGGGLALAALIRARDAGRPSPAAAVVLASPLADMAATGRSFDTNAETDVAISRRSIRALGGAYLGGRDPYDPLVSPVHAALHGLPPTLLLASEREVLLDDARLLADGIVRDGGSARLSVYPQTCHAWSNFAAVMPQAREAVDEIAAFVSGVTA